MGSWEGLISLNLLRFHITRASVKIFHLSSALQLYPSPYICWEAVWMILRFTKWSLTHMVSQTNWKLSETNSGVEFSRNLTTSTHNSGSNYSWGNNPCHQGPPNLQPMHWRRRHDDIHLCWHRTPIKNYGVNPAQSIAPNNVIHG